MQPVFANAGEFSLAIIAAAVVVGVCFGCGLLGGLVHCLDDIRKVLAESVEIMRADSGWVMECSDPECPHCRDTDLDDDFDIDDELDDSSPFFDPDERDRPKGK